jgi:hypothetical protein
MRNTAATFKPIFDPARRTNGASIVAALRGAGFAYSLYPSDNASYSGFESGNYYTCAANSYGYSDYVTSFTESIKPGDQQKLMDMLTADGWTKCRSASALRQTFVRNTRKESSEAYPVDVYSHGGEILNLTTATRSGNMTVVIPWVIRSTTD